MNQPAVTKGDRRRHRLPARPRNLCRQDEGRRDRRGARRSRTMPTSPSPARHARWRRRSMAACRLAALEADGLAQDRGRPRAGRALRHPLPAAAQGVLWPALSPPRRPSAPGCGRQRCGRGCRPSAPARRGRLHQPESAGLHLLEEAAEPADQHVAGEKVGIIERRSSSRRWRAARRANKARVPTGNTLAKPIRVDDMEGEAPDEADLVHRSPPPATRP